MPRVGAPLAVVPVPTMNGGWAVASRPPCGDKRLKKNTSLRTSAHTGVAIPKIERNLPLVVPAKSTGLPRACGPRNDVFSFCAGSSICHPSKCRLRRQERRGRRSLRGSLSGHPSRGVRINASKGRGHPGTGVPTRGFFKTRRGDLCGRPGPHHEWRGAAPSRPTYKSSRRDTPPGVSGPHQCFA